MAIGLVEVLGPVFPVLADGLGSIKGLSGLFRQEDAFLLDKLGRGALLRAAGGQFDPIQNEIELKGGAGADSQLLAHGFGDNDSTSFIH